MRWIDTHVHLFSKKDNNEGMPLLQGYNDINSPYNYFDALGQNKPQGVVIVDFSKSKDSKHVISSLDELKQQNIKAKGIIKADLESEDTPRWLARTDICGVRIYAKDGTANIDMTSKKWLDMLDFIQKNNKHILIFGQCAALPSIIETIPENITIIIDHLGLPDAEKGKNDQDFTKLVQSAKARNNVYFKGPGYRTSMDANKVKPFIKIILQELGAEKLMLGASDGPFAGPVLDPNPEYEGKKFCEVMDYTKVMEFTNNLVEQIANDTEKDKIFYQNAANIYKF